jgi:hypothetical protein
MTRMRMTLLVVGGTLALAGMARASETISYSYDAKGRLILVQHAGTVNNNVVSNYTFDAADNRKNVKTTGAP